MLTYNDFQARTARENAYERRGSNLKEIDDSLKAYWVDANKGVPQKVAHLINIIKACATWFKRKEGKSDYKSRGVANDLFIRRKIAIRDLGEMASVELKAALGSMSGGTPQQKFAAQFHGNKLNALANGLTPVKSMEPSFQPERATYLASEKKKAISGTGMRGAHNDLKNGGAADRANYPAAQSEAVMLAVSKDVNLLTATDFVALDEYVRRGAAGVQMDVVYTKRKDRYRMMVFVDGRGLLRDVNNKLISTNGEVLYAMDRYGNLFYEKQKISGRGIIYNHSSFNAGNDVICAGGILITNGVLKHIDNKSGHYQPSPDHLYNCVKVLNDEDVDLRETTVVATHKEGAGTVDIRCKATDIL